jgi:GWxTD domain-containing protein
MVAYENLPEEDRPKFIRAFWQKRDPTPVSPGNERLVEHYRRVVYALHNFSSKKRGWDRRGDVYIRYGEPAHISRHNNVVYETDPKVIRVRERLLRALSSEAREEIIARAGRYRTSTRNKKIVGEYGQQVEYQDFESIDFEMNPNRSFFIGEQDNSTAYVRGTEEATHRGRMREKPIHGIPLFPVDGGTAWEYWIYTDVAGGIEVVFTALTPKGEFDYPVLPRGRELARFNEKFWEERRSERVITRAKSKQPDRYLPVGDILDFHFAAADFRGRGDRTRLEVYYGVPVRDLAGLNNDNADASGNIFERGIAVFDSTWTPTYRNLVPMAFTTQETEVEAGTLAIDEVALQLRPGRYYLGVQVNHPASNRRNGYTQEWVVDDYRVGGLGLSDIEVAGQVEPDTTISDKGGLKVLPMPSRTFKVGQPVLIYYEVYGLAKDEFGQTRHRVDYRIKPRKGKLSGVRVLRALGRLLGIEEKAIVTISYERSGTDADEQNYLEIDPGDSKEGVYELTVTVTDLMSEQTNEKSTTFLIGK